MLYSFYYVLPLCMDFGIAETGFARGSPPGTTTEVLRVGFPFGSFQRRRPDARMCGRFLTGIGVRPPASRNWFMVLDGNNMHGQTCIFGKTSKLHSCGQTCMVLCVCTRACLFSRNYIFFKKVTVFFFPNKRTTVYSWPRILTSN
jgi:hypothetical protein